MQLFEMQGLLAGKYLPGDIKVNESLAEYLLRKLEDRNELERQLSAKTISEQNIINAFGISGEGAHSKLVIEYVHGLVAENACLKQSIDDIADAVETGTDGVLFSAIDEAVGLNTPATDSVLARIKAQGVEQAADELYGSGYVFDTLKGYVENLRAGRKG